MADYLDRDPGMTHNELERQLDHEFSAIWLDTVHSRTPYKVYDGGIFDSAQYALSDTFIAAAALGMSEVEVEELAFDKKIFTMPAADELVVPMDQFDHGTRGPGVRYAISGRLTEFWGSLPETVPHLSKSPWALWSLLFASRWDPHTGVSGAPIGTLVRTTATDYPRILRNVREELVGLEHRLYEKSVEELERHMGVHIRTPEEMEAEDF